MKWVEIKDNWPAIQEQIHLHWRRLTPADLKSINGRRDVLVSRLQERYAMDRNEAERAAEDFIKNLH